MFDYIYPPFQKKDEVKTYISRIEDALIFKFNFQEPREMQNLPTAIDQTNFTSSSIKESSRTEICLV